VLNLTRRRVGIAAALAGAVLVASACSAGGSSGGDGGDDGAKHDYVQAIAADPESFNAQLTNGATPFMFASQIFDTLIRLSPDYQLTPGLAETWDVSEDGLQITFHLRDGVTWHDGEPFTAEDVKFNLDEIVELQTFGAALAERIANVEVEDERTVVVNFSEPYGPAIETIAGQYMLPKHIYEGTDYVTNPANMAPIGTGPLRFVSFESGKEVIFEANPDYWDGEVQVGRVIYPVIGDPNSRALALFNNEIDQASLDPGQLDQIPGHDSIMQMPSGQFPQDVTIMFNALSGPLQDAEVRKLVFAALDREAITEVALGGRGTPAETFFPEELDWAVNDDIRFSELYPNDIDAINEALDELGYPRGSDGTRFTLKTRYISELSEVASTTELAQSQLQEIGVALDLEASQSAVFTDKVYKESDFELAFLRSTLGSDPSTGIVRWYDCNPDRNAASNPSGICDDEIHEAALGALSTSDREVRGEHFRALQERAAELMFYAPLAWYTGHMPVINTSRWAGQDDPVPATNLMPWTTMEWIGG